MKQIKSRAGTTIILSLSMFLASLGTSIANIALPALVEVFAAPFVEVQMVVVAYLAALTVSVLIAGRLGDTYGLKSMLMTGLALFAVASVLCAVATNLWALTGARALQGIGAAFLMALSMALMRQVADEARIGRSMGLLGTVSALGTALGPSLGGVLMPLTGWRGLFWVQVPLAVTALVLAFVALPDAPGTGGKASSARLWGAMDRKLMASLVVNFLVAAVMMTTLIVGPFYLGRSLGLKSLTVGLVMAIGPVISIFSGVPSGRLVDAWGSERVLGGGLGLMTVGAFLMAVLPGFTGVGGYVAAIIVLTPGYQLFQAANNTAVLIDAPKDRQGTVSGLLSLSRNIGLIAGASAMGAVFASGVGTDDFVQATPEAIAAGMQMTFWVAGGLMIAAMAVVFTQKARLNRIS